jgi:hypothetical protein
LTAFATATNFQEDLKAIKNFLICLEASTKGHKFYAAKFGAIFMFLFVDFLAVAS